MTRDERPRHTRWRGALMLTAALAAGGAVSTLSIDDSGSPSVSAAHAQRRGRRAEIRRAATDTMKDSIAARPLVLVGALAMMALLPFVIIMVTSFVKISVVMSIVRSALGTQQMPPTQVITGIAIIMTVYIMTPVGLEIYKEAQSLIEERQPGKSLLSAETVDLIFEAAGQARVPMRRFLSKHSHLKDRAMFYKMSKRLRRPEDRQDVGPEDFMVLVPAFVISELAEAFQIGFIIFVPFLVIDMVVANILMALGMQMLSPTTISLPFKLLLFVVIDGWYLITRGLIIGYL